MQQFMENDRRVCRFFAILDDVATPQYERRPFTILFFLSDDTVEIREKYPLNCGRDNFPIFFRRGKLASGKVEALGPQDRMPKGSEYVQLQDLYVGADIELVHHKFHLYDADDFTRAYYKEALGAELASKEDVTLPDREVPQASVPPYSGYGSWDDSMSSVLHLIPKVPRRDFHKLYNNDGKILRFTAKFANPKLEDVQRRFVINFHLFDDTLSIHEPPQRNLGIVTGKFLEKGVHLNQATGKLFTPQDLTLGSIVKCFNHEFQILDMDEFSKKFMEGERSGAMLDLQAVLEKLRESMRQQFPLARDVFRRFDTSHNGVISFAEFKQALLKFGFQLSDEEVMVLMRHFDKRQDGQVTYNEFCDALLDEDYTMSMLASKPALDTTHDPEYAGRAAQKSAERAETEKVRKAVREIGDVFYKHTGVMQKMIKEFTHMTHMNYVTCEQIHGALQQIGHDFQVDDVQRCIRFVIPEADMDRIDYVFFVKSLVACYHDLSACR
jgi:Ca2+-binding EF-hand superfamily protein